MSESKPTENNSAFGHMKPLEPFARVVRTPHPLKCALYPHWFGQLGTGGGDGDSSETAIPAFVTSAQAAAHNKYDVDKHDLSIFQI